MRRLKQAGDLRFPTKELENRRAIWIWRKQLPGLGTIVVEALAKQLDARVEIVRNPHGTTVSIAHETPDRAWPPLTGARQALAPEIKRGLGCSHLIA